MRLMYFVYFCFVRYLLPILLSVLYFGNLFSQENQTQTLLKVKALQEKKAEYHRRTNGEVDGYRVKIHFSTDKSKMKEAQARFSNRYSSVATYEEYQLPNWVVNVGDFKTKLEAQELLKTIKSDFPYAFIVKSRIRPSR